VQISLQQAAGSIGIDLGETQGAGTVTVQCDANNINGAASITLASNTGNSVTADGTNCFAH
jgi:hypothetical protein